MTMDRHDDIADALEAYVLGQLAEDERRAVDVHLAACASCAREVRELNDVLATLGQTVPPVAPPAALRQRVLAAAAAEPQDPVRVVGLIKRRHPMWVALPWAAAAALILAVGVVFFRVDSAREQLAVELVQARNDNDKLQERLRRFTAQTDLALSILTAGDMREIPLIGREGAAAAAARAYWSPARGLLVVADRLPAPPPGRIYQVWVIENGQPASAGLLGEESAGRGMLIATPPRADAGTSVTVAVTDEPPGGLPAPSGSIRLAGSI
jgi:anti-sigma-K factor RskA